jgi:hypothetical protein
VAVAERWRSFAAASAVVGRRQASALRSARDRIPKDADGRNTRLSASRRPVFIWLNVIWRQPAPPLALHDGTRFGFLRVVPSKLGRIGVARTIFYSSLRGNRAFTPVFDGLWRRSNPDPCRPTGLLRRARDDERTRTSPRVRGEGVEPRPRAGQDVRDRVRVIGLTARTGAG